MEFLAVSIIAVFGVLGLWHAYWACGGTLAKNSAIPEIDGRPAFSPSPAGTLAVAAVLLGSGGLIAVASGLVATSLPRSHFISLSYGLALILLLRAIGDFRLVGVFKRVRGTRFARLDSFAYSPLCLALSAGIFAVAFRSGP